MSVALLRSRAWSCAVAVAALAAASGCSGPSPAIPAEFTKAPPPPTPYTTDDLLKRFDGPPDSDYRLGEGDAITVNVWDHAELSGPLVVGPDGAITVPVAGTLRVGGLTRDEATKAVKDALAKFYAKISVTVRVDRYASNRVTVLGQVRTPGTLQFDTMPSLLEVIARAGGVLTDDKANLSHCAVIR